MHVGGVGVEWGAGEFDEGWEGRRVARGEYSCGRDGGTGGLDEAKGRPLHMRYHLFQLRLVLEGLGFSQSETCSHPGAENTAPASKSPTNQNNYTTTKTTTASIWSLQEFTAIVHAHVRYQSKLIRGRVSKLVARIHAKA